MIRVLVADDHRLVREGLKQIITKSSNIVVSDEASNVQEVLMKAWENDYDVILLDITMPDRSGLDALKELNTTRPATKILVLSVHPEEQYAVRALKAGALGYLTKNSTPDELVAAIRKVATGGRYVSSSLAERLASYLGNGIAELPHLALSDREYEVMCMLGSGKTVRKIAEQLSLSLHTINTYRYRIMKKMEMQNAAQIVRYVIEHQLLD